MLGCKRARSKWRGWMHRCGRARACIIDGAHPDVGTGAGASAHQRKRPHCALSTTLKLTVVAPTADSGPVDCRTWALQGPDKNLMPSRATALPSMPLSGQCCRSRAPCRAPALIGLTSQLTCLQRSHLPDVPPRARACPPIPFWVHRRRPLQCLPCARDPLHREFCTCGIHPCSASIREFPPGAPFSVPNHLHKYLIEIEDLFWLSTKTIPVQQVRREVGKSPFLVMSSFAENKTAKLLPGW
ncbi:hypothetical protein BC826DRAFT_316433 [Russula brevipes]|nr:hypothetical protein BC826DRAFT_316433 [Russula brevipes]